jgi:hypothetical protein
MMALAKKIAAENIKTPVLWPKIKKSTTAFLLKNP